MILALVPALLIEITKHVKWQVSWWVVFLVPYAISFIIFSGLYFVFDSYSYWVFVLNSVVFAFSATTAYNSAKTQEKEEPKSIHDINSIQWVW